MQRLVFVLGRHHIAKVEKARQKTECRLAAPGQCIRRKLEREAERLDRELAALNAEKAAVDAQLADPALYANSDRARIDSLGRRQAELAAAVETSETRWLEAHAALEALPLG